MRLLRLFKPLRRVGLDFQANTISLLQGEIVNKNRLIKTTGILQLNVPSELAHDFKMSPQFVPELSKLVAQTQSQGLATAMALPIEQTQCKRIKLQGNLTLPELYTLVVDNNDYYFPGATTAMRYAIMRLANNEWLAFATPYAQIEQALALSAAAGLVVQAMDIDAYAFIRLLPTCVHVSDQHIAVIVLNSVTALFFIYCQQEVIFYQRMLADKQIIVMCLQNVVARDEPLFIQNIFLIEEYGSDEEITAYIKENSACVVNIIKPLMVTHARQQGLTWLSYSLAFRKNWLS